MIIIYFIAYIIAIASCGFFGYQFSNGNIPIVKDKAGKLKKLLNEDLFNIFGGLKKRFANKKSVFLIKLAQAGFIRIRKDENGKIYIDKLRDFDSLGDNIRSIISEVFSDNVTFYGDDSAIMSYETVSWDDAKSRYRKKIDDVLTGFTNEQLIDEGAKKTKVNPIKAKLIVMWLIGLLPLAISYAYADYAYLSDEVFADFFAIYVMTFIEYIMFVVELRGIKVLWRFVRKERTLPKVLDAIVKGVGWFLLFDLASFIIMGVFFSTATVSICEEMVDFPLNVILAIILVLITLYAIVFKNKTNTGTNPESIYASLFSRKNIMKAIGTKEDYNNAVTYAYMFDKMKELNAANQEKELCPEWYEGEDWQNEEELMLQLDTK